MFNIAVMLEDSARTVPDRTAIVCGDVRLSYAEVDAAANRVAHLLVSRGIEPGDKVALTCPNLHYFPVIYYGILKAGAVVVPLNVLFKPREIAYHLTDSDAVAYFCFEGVADLPMGECGREAFGQVDGCREFFLVTLDPAGDVPDGVDSYADAVADQPDHIRDANPSRRRHGRDPVHLGNDGSAQGRRAHPREPRLQRADQPPPLPEQPDGSGCPPGRAAAVPLVRPDRAAELRVRRRRDPRAAPTLRRGGGAHAHAARDRSRSSPACRRCTGGCSAHWTTRWMSMRSPASCGARSRADQSLPVEIINQVRDRFHVQILEGYGLSETSPVATFSRPGMPPRPGSIGTPIWGVEVKLIDDDWTTVDRPGEVGEIAIRGHNIMKGYYRPPRGDRRGHARRLVPLGGSRDPRRGRVLLHRRPGEGHDRPRRLQRVPA